MPCTEFSNLLYMSRQPKLHVGHPVQLNEDQRDEDQEDQQQEQKND